MPRVPRRLGASGYMHVIVRGIGRQILFDERQDYLFFLSRLRRFCEETGVRLCAYCLMDNHVHLLLKDPENRAALLMKKLGVSYSYYFNKKHDRSGHLFQDRYLSEAIDTDAYFLTVLRYILNNPRKAGICATPEYEWNSYTAYGDPDSFVDTSLARELLGDRESYAAFIAQTNDDKCLEFERSARNDEWAATVLRECLGVESGLALQAFDRKARNDALRKLKERGLTVRQIERLTGLNRGVIQKS